MELLYDERAREDVYTWRGRICTAGRSRWCADSDYTGWSQLNGGRAAVQPRPRRKTRALVKRESAGVAGAGAGCSASPPSGRRLGAAQVICGYGGGARERQPKAPSTGRRKVRVLDQALFANELGVAFRKGDARGAGRAASQAVIDDMRGDGSAEAIVACYGLDAKKCWRGTDAPGLLRNCAAFIKER